MSEMDVRESGLQMSTDCLLRGEMVQIGTGDTEATLLRGTADGAGTSLFHGTEVLAVGVVAETQRTGGNDSIAKSLYRC